MAYRDTLVDVKGNPLFQDKATRAFRKLLPGGEVEEIVSREATQQVEEELRLEDSGWINLSLITGDVVTALDRQTNLVLSRLYYTKDPMAKQSIRLWTDYTFGTGMTWDTEDDPAKKVLEAFWDSPANHSVLSDIGQRKSSNKLLVDGEIFFALFLGPKGDSKIRRIDPLQITEIITDKDDLDDVRFYRRQWSDAAGGVHDEYYRSITNKKGEPGYSLTGTISGHTEDALIYHLPFGGTGQRGDPLLLPALDWIKQYRRFLASRIAIMLALARFAWHTKVKGGQAAVDTVKAVTEGQEINAASQLLENFGVDTKPIKQESGARNAYEDGRQIKLMIAAAVGIPEQYYGDISIGNLATAKTVELPMMKMFQSYQALWLDANKTINNVILEHNGIAPEKRYVDMDFPRIAPQDVLAAAEAIVNILGVFPEFVDSPDVQQIAMMTIGVNDPAEALAQLDKMAEANPNIALTKILRKFKESIKNNGAK